MKKEKAKNIVRLLAEEIQNLLTTNFEDTAHLYTNTRKQASIKSCSTVPSSKSSLL